jgi:hypothetical protein
VGDFGCGGGSGFFAMPASIGREVCRFNRHVRHAIRIDGRGHETVFGDIAKPGGGFATVYYPSGLSRNLANLFSRWISHSRTWCAISSQRS